MTAGGDQGSTEHINTDIVTLTRFLTEEQSKHKEATGDFTYVILALQLFVSSLSGRTNPDPDSFATPFSSPSNR
jgi:fructose-1,6-bisphosphatase I